MIVVSYQRTMAGAKKRLIDVDRKRPTPMRNRLIELSLRWEQEKERTRVAKRQAFASIIARHNVVSVPVETWTSAKEIISMVAFWHGVPVHEITGQSKVWPVIAARFDAVAAVAVNCRVAGQPLTLANIGRHFNRDHSTILVALRKLGLR